MNCSVNCSDPSTEKSPTITWIPDSTTVASIDSIDNFHPNPFSDPPTNPNWVGTLLPEWQNEPFTYTITITPYDPVNCKGPFTKGPTITVSAPWIPHHRTGDSES